MDSTGFKRKLSAILSADVVGYSRLMGEDDDATVRTLTGHREPEQTVIRLTGKTRCFFKAQCCGKFVSLSI